ncbi:hypothetical protein L6164_031753 [Bauhinia variegata]|uniref:Uncharacterized protein n=1 Tax=Bauhinia variegata TaxID=167791 RepID=A0ACB9KLN9_BAUVA|nr:hypothetical protein L6164_031753 [Bauhinia variegata]
MPGRIAYQVIPFLSTLETVKTTQSSSAEGDKHKQSNWIKRRDQRDGPCITHPFTDFQRSGSTHHLEDEDEDDRGVKIITLAHGKQPWE